MSNFHTKEDELPILTKTTELYKLFYQYLELFPKKDKYALGAKCEKIIIIVLELLLAAKWLPRDEKRKIIQQASLKLDALKVFVRILQELEILDMPQYTQFQKKIYEIGQELGGWLKSLPYKNTPYN